MTDDNDMETIRIRRLIHDHHLVLTLEQNYARNYYRWIVDTRKRMTRDGLIKMGWRPPKGEWRLGDIKTWIIKSTRELFKKLKKQLSNRALRETVK